MPALKTKGLPADDSKESEKNPPTRAYNGTPRVEDSLQRCTETRFTGHRFKREMNTDVTLFESTRVAERE
jgi:hypothetical protein